MLCFDLLSSIFLQVLTLLPLPIVNTYRGWTVLGLPSCSEIFNTRPASLADKLWLWHSDFNISYSRTEARDFTKKGKTKQNNPMSEIRCTMKRL